MTVTYERADVLDVVDQIKTLAAAYERGSGIEAELLALHDLLAKLESPHTDAIYLLLQRGVIHRSPDQRWAVCVGESVRDDQPLLHGAGDDLGQALRRYCQAWRHQQGAAPPRRSR